jgi:hypothetical protein
MDKKLIRVEFFYDDGTSKFIEGNELDKWGGMNRQVALFCQIHRNNPDWGSVKWTFTEAVGPKEQPQEDTTHPATAPSALD